MNINEMIDGKTMFSLCMMFAEDWMPSVFQHLTTTNRKICDDILISKRIIISIRSWWSASSNKAFIRIQIDQSLQYA